MPESTYSMLIAKYVFLMKTFRQTVGGYVQLAIVLQFGKAALYLSSNCTSVALKYYFTVNTAYWSGNYWYPTANNADINKS